MAKRANVFHLGGDSSHTEKWPVVTSQKLLFNFIHTNDRNMDTLVLSQ